MKWQEFLKRIRCLLACCNSQIVAENSQLDGKPPANEQGGATEGTILWSQNPASCAGKSKLSQETGDHLIMNKEELLKKLHYDLKNPAAYAGKSKLL